MKWLFLFLVTNAFADIEDKQVEQKEKILLESKSIQQLKQSLAALDRQDLLEKSCTLELQLKKVPVNCYEFAEFKKTHGEIMNVTAYDRTCEDNADRMQEVVKTAHLSKRCRALVSKRNQEIEYSRE